MKVFRVVTERDGKTTKTPGCVSTEVVRHEMRFAAETIQDVWGAIAWVIDDPEQTLIAVHEDSPAITVLRPKAEQST